ncbi:AAA family ATPase [Bartonella sp. cb54]|uniref:AAA family ATPase n=1 Tax=Bartonella sp. cb54 TaxID=3385560 RepID=UPI0039A68DBB
MQFVAFEFENFKGISDPVKIDLKDGNLSFPFVLIGENGSGKTTIFDGIYLIYCLLSDVESLPCALSYLYAHKLNGKKNTIITAYLSYNESEEKELKKINDIIDKDASNDNRILKISFSCSYYGIMDPKISEYAISINDKIMPQNGEIFKWVENAIPHVIYNHSFMNDGKFDRTPIIFNKSSPSKELTFGNGGAISTFSSPFWKKTLNAIFIACRYKNDNHCVSCKNLNDYTDFQKNMLNCTDQDTVKKNLKLMNDYLNSAIGESLSDINKSKKKYKLILEHPAHIFPDNVAFRLLVESSDTTLPLEQQSAGFRSLICFKILTNIYPDAIRNKNGIIFLLDEPANNLHIGVQKTILNSLNNLSKIENNKVIYSTHSSFLINKDVCENIFHLSNCSSITCEKVLDQKMLKEIFTKDDEIFSEFVTEENEWESLLDAKV